MGGYNALLTTTLLVIGTVGQASTDDELEKALKLSYSPRPEVRIQSLKSLSDVHDARVGKRVYELADDVVPAVKAEVLLLAMNGKFFLPDNAYRYSLYQEYRLAIKDLGPMPEEERREAERKIYFQHAVEPRKEFSNRPVHMKWLVEYSKKIKRGSLHDRIATLIIKNSASSWGYALDWGFICGTGAPTPYDARPDMFDLFNRNPELCHRLAASDDNLAISLYGAFAERSDQLSIDPLSDLLRSENKSIRAISMLALSQVSREAVARNSKRLLKDPDGIVRGATAIAMLASDTSDTSDNFDAVKELCASDHQISEQVFQALISRHEYEDWRSTGLNVAILPGLTDERVAELCTEVVLNGNKNSIWRALVALSTCHKDIAIKTIVDLVPKVRGEQELEMARNLLKRLGYVPPPLGLSA